MKAIHLHGIALAMLLFLSSCVVAPGRDHDVSHDHTNIGVSVSSYPRLAIVPGYPVYYAPGLSLNFFFYDGLYWLYHDDRWYSSSWYNGPWWSVGVNVVPRVILQVPVRYYRKPPPYFRDWRPDAPPRWNERWGRDWERRRGDWDKPDRHDHPATAPLPDYQHQYSGEHYPRQIERQYEIRQRNYPYQPRDPEARKQYEQEERKTPGQQRKPDRPNAY
jgi:hypothetical protein